jgi:hypothetical protein
MKEEKKMQELKKGDIGVTENGDVVVISRVEVQADDVDSYGRVHIFHVGTYLRSSTVTVGSRWNGKVVRAVLHASELLKLAEAAGHDLTTPAEKPDSELTEIERLQRRVAELECYVPRPRAGIAALNTTTLDALEQNK